MRTTKLTTKTEFVRLRIDNVEKERLEKLCAITRRQKSDIVRESLFELYKQKYPECLLTQ
jgi:predicted DNA-binding protein